MTLAAATQGRPAAGAQRRARTPAEAARYGVLRRLAPALKHDMVVHLQAIAMLAEVLTARLERGTPAPADFEASISKMNRLAREAVLTCLKVAAWIAPSEEETIHLREGVDDCVALLRSGFNFRGCGIDNRVPDSDFEVSRVALRYLVPAALIALADEMQGPGELLLTAEVAGGTAVFTGRCTPHPPEDGAGIDAIASLPAYRAIDWADVEALAAAEQVELLRAPGEVVLRLPRMVATGPLQIAPV